MYDRLTKGAGLRVWWDMVCLEGQDWMGTGFSDGLAM
jgi:hypothetical protein